MKKLKNEQGYALLVVVLLVVFIMGFFATFMTASLSNAKQEQVVDQKILTVVAAEMGVNYYSNALLNEYYRLISEESDNLIESLKTFSENLIDPEDVEKDKVIDGYTYHLTSFKEDTEQPIDTNEFRLVGSVKGINSNNSNNKELTFKQTFDVPDFTFAPPTYDYDEINKPNGKCNSNEISKKTVIEVECSESGGFYFDQKGTLDNSILYVKGNFIAKNNFTINESTLYVVGDFSAGPGNTLNILGTSKICVIGSLDFQQNTEIDSGSEIYVLGSSEPNDYRVKDIKEFDSKCGISESISNGELSDYQVEVDVTY